MVGITYGYNDTIFAFDGYFLCLSLLLSLMSEHDCLDTCCCGCLVCICFGFFFWGGGGLVYDAVVDVLYAYVLGFFWGGGGWYMHLFSTIEHVSHGKAL